MNPTIEHLRAQRAFYRIIFVIGILCFADFLFLISIGIVINVGTAFPGVFGLFLVLLWYLKVFKNVKIIRNPVLAKITALCLTFLFASFILIQILIWTSCLDESNKKADYVILLGAGLKGDVITATFMNRMENCVRYLEANPGVKAVVSGGQGYGESISEAEAMKRYLVQKGIGEERVLKEDKATSTNENFLFSRQVLERSFGAGRYSVMIITSDFHMFRTKMLARRNGYIAYGIPSRTWWGVFPNSCIREYFAVIKSFLFDR